jgi:hypothetical protein
MMRRFSSYRTTPQPSLPSAALTSTWNSLPPLPAKSGPLTNHGRPPRGQTSPTETAIAALAADGLPVNPPISDHDLTSPSNTKFHILARVAHAPAIVADLNEEVLQEIFTTTLAHHQLRLPNNLLAFQIGLIAYWNTGKFNSRQRNRRAHYYHLILIAETDSTDAFDNEIHTDQCLTFAPLQKWHLYKNSQFNTDGSLRRFAYIDPLSTNPWARHIDLLLPAVNSSKDTALGCLLGVSPEVFGGSRRATIDIMSVIFYHISPYLGHTALSHHLDNWHTFQEFFGLRVSELKHSNKTSRLFFLCCFCDEAWSALYDAATAAGPVNIHGIWTKISEFPPESAKLRIITNQNAIVDRQTDLHPFHTDRLLIAMADDEKRLLLHTPNLAAVIPRFVDHLPDPACHTLLFRPDPSTLSISPDTIHLARKIPADLLTNPPPSPYLRAATAKAKPTNQRPPSANKFDDSDLDLIFGQCLPPAQTTATIPNAFSKPSPKRHRPDDASTITTATPSSDATSNYYAGLQDDDDDDDNADAANPDSSLRDFNPSIYATPPTSPRSSRPHANQDDDAIMPPPSPIGLLQEHEADLSQDAMASHATSEAYVLRNHPNQHGEFVTMLTNSISQNKDPALLATTVRGWLPHQP